MSDKLVSLLIPTRLRAFALANLVENIIETSDDPTSFEILFKTDDDDIDSITAVNKIIEEYSHISITNHISPRPERKYRDIHLMYNELASICTGKFIWVLNDDIVFLSMKWDQTIRKYHNEEPIIIKAVYNIDNPNANIFPLIHRGIYDTIQTLGIHSSIDTQYELLTELLPTIGIFEPRLAISHTRGLPDTIGEIPPFDPAEIYSYRNIVEQHATLLKEKYEHLRQ